MKHIRGNTYYAPEGVVIGAYKVENALLLIDSGNDDSSARKAIRDFEDIAVNAVFNTHSHADHCGGNAFLQKRFGATIIAPSLEAAFIENPVLEPTYLYGAAPLKALHNKFLMATPSKVNITLDDTPFDFVLSGEAVHFKTVRLNGHSPNQHALITPDDIAFLGDALVSETVVSKHPLIFTYDVTAHLASLETLKTLQASAYVIAHGGLYTSISDLIDINKNALLETQMHLHTQIKKGKTSIDKLHSALCDHYQLTENLNQHLLNRSVLMAHITALVDAQLCQITSEKGHLLVSPIA